MYNLNINQQDPKNQFFQSYYYYFLNKNRVFKTLNNLVYQIN
ncbi:hypothetical protein Flavo103_11010 [Flavobacterium collinsii]|nr:hypothetical protein Flavo103_11010 [Flavobacterium collinsii]